MQQKLECHLQEIQHLQGLLNEERVLSLDDLRLNDRDATELKAFSVLSRVALYKACEIVRLCEAVDGEGRKAVERLRNKLMELTMDDHNVLPHEQTKVRKTALEPKDHSPLLPRFDNI